MITAATTKTGSFENLRAVAAEETFFGQNIHEVEIIFFSQLPRNVVAIPYIDIPCDPWYAHTYIHWGHGQSSLECKLARAKVYRKMKGGKDWEKYNTRSRDFGRPRDIKYIRKNKSFQKVKPLVKNWYWNHARNLRAGKIFRSFPSTFELYYFLWRGWKSIARKRGFVSWPPYFLFLPYNLFLCF